MRGDRRLVTILGLLLSLAALSALAAPPESSQSRDLALPLAFVAVAALVAVLGLRRGRTLREGVRVLGAAALVTGAVVLTAVAAVFVAIAAI